MTRLDDLFALFQIWGLPAEIAAKESAIVMDRLRFQLMLSDRRKSTAQLFPKLKARGVASETGRSAATAYRDLNKFSKSTKFVKKKSA